MESSELPPVPETEKPRIIVGETAINGKKFSFGSREEHPREGTKFTLLDTETGEEAASGEQVSLELSPVFDVAEMRAKGKEPIYGEIPKATNPREAARNLLIKSGFREPPIVGTRTLLAPAPELTAASFRRDPALGVIPAELGWRLNVANNTPPEVLEKIGIRPEELYEGREAEEEKRFAQALAAEQTKREGNVDAVNALLPDDFKTKGEVTVTDPDRFFK